MQPAVLKCCQIRKRQKEIFLTNEITVFRNLRTESLYIWLKVKHIVVSVLTVYLIFQFVKIFLNCSSI